MRTVIAALAAAIALVAPAAAGAHIQVTPARVAPNDPVKFTVLVPGERSEETTRVELKLPDGLLPFSFGETPGWRREVLKAPNGAIDRVVWTGRLAADGFAEFSFLAGTPEQPGELELKALQTYADGDVVRWIGGEGSEHPAAVVHVAEDAARVNAGGEGGESSAPPPAAAGAESTPAATVAAASSAAPDDGRDPLAIVALALAAAALALALRKRRAG